MHDTPLNAIIQKYYAEIFRYCVIKLNQDYHGAEDCTQDVFCLLIKKADTVDISKDIRSWLYASANKMILSYKRKHPNSVELESVSEENLAVDFSYNDLLLSLEEDEKKLLIAYFSGADKATLAKEYGISQIALYKRISRIKEKLRRIIGDN